MVAVLCDMKGDGLMCRRKGVLAALRNGTGKINVFVKWLNLYRKCLEIEKTKVTLLR